MFFLLVFFPPSSYAEEEWIIDRFKDLSYARVSGEITHGDSLNFFISTADDCTKVYNNFTFYTYEKPGDIKQLEDKNIPIKINGLDLTANVISVSPFLMGYRISFSLGKFPIKEYIYFLKEFYDEFGKYEIEIVDGVDFKVAKYFDIPVNSWKLDKLIPSINKAQNQCSQIFQTKLWLDKSADKIKLKESLYASKKCFDAYKVYKLKKLYFYILKYN